MAEPPASIEEHTSKRIHTRRSAIKSASKFTCCETSTGKNNIDIITVNIKYMISQNAPQTQSVGFLVALQVMSSEGEHREVVRGREKTPDMMRCLLAYE